MAGNEAEKDRSRLEDDMDPQKAKGLGWVQNFGNHSNDSRKELERQSVISAQDRYRGAGNKDTLINFRTTKSMAKNINSWVRKAKTDGVAPSKAAFIEEACIAFAKQKKWAK